MQNKIKIFDCDNVLANDAWRIPMINWRAIGGPGRWHAYHLASAFDEAGNRHLMTDVRSDCTFIFTAMPEHYRTLRTLWLNHQRIGYHKLFMRQDHDCRHSVDVKRSMLYELFDQGIRACDIEAAYDDRQDVVDMYLAMRVPGKLISLHSVCACTPPSLETI